MSKLKLSFDSQQDYQLEAIQHTIKVLEGVPRQMVQNASFMGEMNIVGNYPNNKKLDAEMLLGNLQEIQCQQIDEGKKDMGVSHQLIHANDHGQMLDGVTNDEYLYPHFAVEMETGTGKTYVYLRSIYELHKNYGFTKFIIVVPSIAIRLGVSKSFETMEEHFRSLYGNTQVVLFEYDSSKIGQLRTFATSQDVQVMVITLHAFNKASNNIYKPTEKLQGEWLPYQYIQATRPILILDEPQNMTSDKSLEALRTLKPLFALRYSATFPNRNVENFLYRLTPVEAFQKGLVKRIQVVGISEEDNLQQAPIVLRNVQKKGGKFEATVVVYSMASGVKIRKEILLKQNDNLYEKTHNKAFLGYVVHNISAQEDNQYVEFSNGETIYLSDALDAASRPAIFRYQINAAIEKHFERQALLRSKGIKVLSLFFVDKVANYVNNGLIRKLFDEEFERQKRTQPFFKDLKSSEVQASYFACYKNKKEQDKTEYLDTDSSTDAEKELEQEQFRLIMKAKEELLSFDNKVSFIFAHSALREGWDNPNVFQICTLNNTVSVIRKRQEIGRGLRICVNQEGKRIFGNDINILTVIANESYESFANSLQQEYQEDGSAAPPSPTDVTKKRAAAVRRDSLYQSEHFRVFWAKLLQRTQYKINIKTKELIKKCQKAFKERGGQLLAQPKIMRTEGGFELSQIYISLVEDSVSENKATLQIKLESKDSINMFGSMKDFTMEVDEKTDMEAVLNRSKDGRLIKHIFRGFKVNEIKHTGSVKSVEFKNGYKVTDFQTLSYPISRIRTQASTALDTVSQTNVPLKFNLLKRAADATGLTIATIQEIFREISVEYKIHLFQNPDFFANNFITVIKNVLAEHIAQNVTFDVIGGEPEYDLEDLFPPVQTYVQTETIPSNDKGLYDLIQKDSEVERIFVQERLHQDGQLVLYFKFPNKFKIQFPKIIHNYTPDWGILREIQDENGKRFIVELVRETKGTTDVNQLRFLGEQRKIDAAIRFFNTIGIDYKVVSHETLDWH